MYKIVTKHKTIETKANWSITIGGMMYLFWYMFPVLTLPEFEIKELLWSK